VGVFFEYTTTGTVLQSLLMYSVCGCIRFETPFNLILACRFLLKFSFCITF